MSTPATSDRSPPFAAIEDREKVLLAPYAMHSADSAGRKYAEAEHAYRGPYQRDRDRIVHSAAFRRLSGKMQVFTGSMGDYHRTRLTHTMEVASIARTVGRALGLNEDLIEALSVLHDIGHPPFGHAGEDALAECLAEEGGFSHNRYALTLVEELEQRYPAFPGLNLTYEVLEGQRARVGRRDHAGASPLLEVQVVDAADSITYNAHDVDDAIKLNLVSLEQLFEIPLAGRAAELAGRGHVALGRAILRKAVVHALIDSMVTDVIRTSSNFLSTSGWDSPRAVGQSDFRIGPSAPLRAQKAELESFLHQRVYRHDRLARVRALAQRKLRDMFHGYQEQPHLLPGEFQRRAELVGMRQSVAEYLAGMTDRFCLKQYRQHFAARKKG
jgi:dGTPase